MKGLGKSGAETSLTGSYFTPLLISMAGVIATSLAILAYHFIMVRYCLRRRRRQRALLNNNNSNTTQIITGLDEKILNSMPILSYSTKLLSDQFRLDPSECAICLGELEDNDMVRLLPNCRHVFHISCVDKWFLAHTNCPVCRSEMGSVEIKNSQEIEGDDQDQDDQELLNNDRDQVQYSNGLLRHCVSLVLPKEEKQECLVTRLKRSLSLDQYSLVVVKVKTEPDINNPSSSNCSRNFVMEGKSYCGAVSLRRLDRMSSMLMRPISQLRTCHNNNSGNEILRCPV